MDKFLRGFISPDSGLHLSLSNLTIVHSLPVPFLLFNPFPGRFLPPPVSVSDPLPLTSEYRTGCIIFYIPYKLPPSQQSLPLLALLYDLVNFWPLSSPRLLLANYHYFDVSYFYPFDPIVLIA